MERSEKRRPPIPQEIVDRFVSTILREHLWATPEETAAWAETERGREIVALINEYRRTA